MPVPDEIRANFDVEFSVEDMASEVPSGYTPKFVLGGASSLSDTGAVNGDDIDFALTAAQTAALTTGQYWYQVVAENGAARTFIADGTIFVRGAISGSGSYDGRSTAEIIVEAIDAVMANKATADQQSYVIQTQLGSRSLNRMSMDDLLKARQYYRGIVLAEKRAREGSSLFKQHTFSPSRVL